MEPSESYKSFQVKAAFSGVDLQKNEIVEISRLHPGQPT